RRFARWACAQDPPRRRRRFADARGVRREQLLAVTPVRAAFHFSRCAGEAGRLDEAQGQLAGVVARFPDQPEVLRLLAGIESLRGRTREAIDAMRRAV